MIISPTVNIISFQTIMNYWIEVDHFQNPDKKYVELPKKLGHLISEIEQPRSICYGLFHEAHLIGVTQLIEWAPATVRYRTINIRTEYRGHKLGIYLLDTVLKKDWSDCQQVFGWVRRSHVDWSLRHGFHELDGIWNDDHIAMVKKL